MRYIYSKQLLAAALLVAISLNLHAQGTAFTYQGFLNNGGSPANGVYDFKFSLATNALAGTFSSSVTNMGMNVSNGLFVTAIDFGGIPDGRPYWLEIAIRTNGAVSFNTLSPRQQLTPAPYAMFANTASNLAGTLPASQVYGSLSAAQISGVLSNTQLPAGVITNGSSGVSLAGSFNGIFAGNGSGLTNIGSSALAPGTALANLQSGNQGAVPFGGMIISPNFADPNLLNAGYQRTGLMKTSDFWGMRSNNPALYSRMDASAVWTGTELLIWGGDSASTILQTGWKYNPAYDTWTPMSTNNAPGARWNHSAVWTGSEMIIWGGVSNATYYADGKRYNPVTDTWANISNLNAPAARNYHSAVWSGTEMIVWGGVSNSTYYANGSRYNPILDTWTDVSSVNAPLARAYHAGVWDGSEMIIWGGGNATTNWPYGARYSPALNTWTTISNSYFLNTPYGYSGSQAIWAGGRMILCGGYNSATGYNQNLSSYNPSNDVWTLANTVNSPLVKNIIGMSLVWTGTKAVVWGGVNASSTFFNSGGIYDWNTQTWTPMTLSNAPLARVFHAAIWTGSEMIIWGGQLSGSGVEDTWSYEPPRDLYLYEH